MVRTYKKKTTRGEIPVDAFKRAASLITQENVSIRTAADRCGINFMTLYRYMKKAKLQPNIQPSIGYATPSKIFTSEQEEELAQYVEYSSKIYYGLTTRDLRMLAYDLAVANNIRVHDSWKIKGMASKDWLFGFLKRHQNLSVRTPEATSLSRATSFNRTNVELFFNNLAAVYDKHAFQANDVYNVDETGLTTVQKPSKIIAKKGSKQVGAITSGERGVLVTMALAVNAAGNSVPPMLIFPRKRFKPFMTINGPTGCIGGAHPSGWMTGENFLQFIHHFVAFSKCSKDKPVLLILDNHESHLAIPVLNYCKDNGVVLLSFPPHTSHRLQPLDRTVYGPLKRCFNSQADGWLKSHPGTPMNIYDIPTILKEALPLAATPTNIQKGFLVTSEVTNREDNDTAQHNSSRNILEEAFHQTDQLPVRHSTPSPQPSTSTGERDAITHHVTPQQLKPFPKASSRKNTVNRRKRKSAVLTDTPIKDSLEKEAIEKESRKKKPKGISQVKKNLSFKNGKLKKKVTKKLNTTDSEDSDDAEDNELLIENSCPWIIIFLSKFLGLRTNKSQFTSTSFAVLF